MKSWVNRLLSGEDGSKIVDEMRDHYKTDCSLMTRISTARRLFMTAIPTAKQRNRHESFDASLVDLKREADKLGSSNPCAQNIQEFLSVDLRHMYAEWRRRPYLQPGCVYTEPVQSIFKAMKILPDNMDSFRVPRATLHECLAESGEARIEKNEVVTVVQRADQIFTRISVFLNDPHSCNLSELIVALCIVSGRRLGEIASPRSSFYAMVPKYEHGVMFSGQLKQTKLQATEAYAIPILGVSASVFLLAINALRARQDPQLATRLQSEISGLYQSNARKYLYGEFPMFHKIHELRTFYAACVFQSFEWSHAFPRVVMYILGHSNLDYFIHYNSIQIEGYHEFYGKFPVDVVSVRTKPLGRLTLAQRKTMERMS